MFYPSLFVEFFKVKRGLTFFLKLKFQLFFTDMCVNLLFKFLQKSDGTETNNGFLYV